MIFNNHDINCTNARLYYYDFLSREKRDGIPAGALDHITQCLNCQSEVDRLKGLFIQADERFGSEQSRKNSAIGTLLRLHFEYVGEPVKCSTVKPFLASLADPVLHIKIPTPITVHIDQCRACRDDLLTLLDLQLPHKYLCRLGQVLADEPAEDTVSCSEARAAIDDVVSMDFHKTNAEILKHLCTCSEYRRQLYLSREALRKKLPHDEVLENEFPCESVSAADIYDYCLPYGIDPADDQYAGFRESLTSHLRGCPSCLAKMQELHLTIYNIAEHSESETVTVYNIDESSRAKPAGKSGPYAGFPIGVETAAGKDKVDAEQPVTVLDSAAVPAGKTNATKFKPLFKAGLAAAAVILIGLALLFNAPAAKAMTIKEICKAIADATNVYIATFPSGQTEPEQQIWVSRTLNVYLSQNEQESVLTDIPNRIVKVKNLNTGVVETVPLQTEMISAMENMIAGYIGLVPPDLLDVVQEDAELKPIPSNGLDIDAEGIEVYELTWTKETYTGNSKFRKWQVFVDPEKKRPVRAKIFRNSEDNTEFDCVSEMVIEYPSDSDMEAHVKEASN
ncbi:MAG TPA: hypothetical protein DIU00_03610 [Phycisphaerales bacterium]|nr:hypothetical protein [Phycisphaerales bacterium]